MGSWTFVPNTFSSEKEVRTWALTAWRLEGDLKVVLLGMNSMLFKFERPEEADSVIDTGKRRLQGNTLKLKRWNPSVECERSM